MQASNSPSLTRSQLATELGVSVFTLNQWAVSGKGPKAIRIGRQSVYRREDIDAYKATIGSTESTPAPVSQPVGSYMMRLPEVLSLSGLSKSSIYAMSKAGEFPASVKLGSRAVGWPSHLVMQWLNDRMGNVA